MSKPVVLVTNYGTGENSVLLVNEGIRDGLVSAGMVPPDGDLSFVTPRDGAENDRFGYGPLASNKLKEWMHNNGRSPDIIIGQACVAYEVFKTAMEECPDTIRILQRDSTHAGFRKKLLDAEMRRIGLPVNDNMDGVNRECAEYDMADYITTLSHWVTRSFYSEGIVDKVRYFGSQTIDLPKWNPMPRNEDGCDFRVMVCGSIEVRKGTHIILEAWKEIHPRSNDELVFSGVITLDQEKEFLQDMINSTPNVRVLGWQFMNVMPLRYSECDVYCLPSIEEGSSMTCLEAMACGRPLVASDASGSDILEENDGVVGKMVKAGDVWKLADTIDAYRHHDEVRRAHGIHARKKVVETGGMGRFGADYARTVQKIWDERVER